MENGKVTTPNYAYQYNPNPAAITTSSRDNFYISGKIYIYKFDGTLVYEKTLNNPYTPPLYGVPQHDYTEGCNDLIENF